MQELSQANESNVVRGVAGGKDFGLEMVSLVALWLHNDGEQNNRQGSKHGFS